MGDCLLKNSHTIHQTFRLSSIMAPARIDEDTGSTTGGESWANSGSCRPSFANTEDKLEPIAVIGFSIKFPQEAVSPESFWDMLTEARSAMTDFPKDRFNLNSFYHPDANRHDTVSESCPSGEGLQNGSLFLKV